MAEPTERAVAPNIEALQERLSAADFDNKLAIDNVAKQTIGTLAVKAEEFKEQFDASKPENVEPWDHNRSIQALDAQLAEETRSNNADAADKIRTERSRVDAALVKPQQKGTERDQETVEAEREAVATRTASAAVTASQQSQDAETEVITQGRDASEEGIENRGSITESRVTALPEEFDKKFTITNKLGSDRYLHKGTEQEAFRDTGSKIIVKPEARKLVASDVAKLADSKGWTDIKVTGNEQFRREVWQEANVRGIEVVGYNPTEQDKRDLDKRLASIEAAPRDNQSERENAAIAPKVATASIGETSSANPEVAKRREELATSYRDDPRDVAVGKHPELDGLYKLEGAANQFAETSIADRTSQEKFVSQVRDRGLDELSRGNKLPELKVAPLRPQQEKGLPGLGR